MQPPHSGLEELGVTLRFCDLRAAGLPAGSPRAPIIPAGTSPAAHRENHVPGGPSHSPAYITSEELPSELESQTSGSPGLLSEQGLKLTWSLGEM